jgi:hypothetical protein
MRFYLVSDTINPHKYCGTLKEAHTAAKGMNTRFVEIQEVEIATDKRNLLRILNEEGGYEGATIKAWSLTPRGGLKIDS